VKILINNFFLKKNIDRSTRRKTGQGEICNPIYLIDPPRSAHF